MTMFNTHRILAFVPARGGSKGIPNKNIIHLGGEPLIAYAIKASRASMYIDDIIVSTDDLAIAEVALAYGAEVPFLRPSNLAEDRSEIIEAVLHALDFLRKIGRTYDAIVLLQPTQPLRTSLHIDKAIEDFYEQGEKPLVSVSPVSSSPILTRSIGKNGELVPVLNRDSTVRRQDMPVYFYVNGCIYINKVDTLTHKTSFNDNPLPYIMAKQYAVDIDEPEDLELAEFYFRQLKRQAL